MYMICPLDLSVQQQHIYTLLYKRSDFKTMAVKYTAEQLALDSNSIFGISEKMVRTILAQLKDKNYIQEVEKGKKGSPTTYRICKEIIIENAGQESVTNWSGIGQESVMNDKPTPKLSGATGQESVTNWSGIGQESVSPISNKDKDNNNYSSKDSLSDEKPPDELKVKKYNADADPTNKYHQAAVHFAEMVLKANPTCKVPKEGTESMGKWAREIRLMFESDKRDREHVRETLTYCFEKDAFWSHTCQSPANFRKNYDKISGKMLSNQKTGVNKPNSKFSQSIDTMNEWLIEQEAKTIG